MADVSTFSEAILPVVLLLFALQRLTMYRQKPRTRPLTVMLLTLSAAQSFRIHALADDKLDPILHRATGLWNLSVLVAQILAVCAATQLVGIVAHSTQRRFPRRYRYSLSAALSIALGVSFLLSPAPTRPTHFLSQTFTAEGWMLVYWVIFLGSLALCVIVPLYLLVRMALIVRTGELARVLIGAALACAMVLLYAVHKIAYLVAFDRGIDNWYTHHTVQISLFLIMSPLIFAGYVAAVYVWTALLPRVQRYRRIVAYMERWQILATQSNAILAEALIPSSKRTAWKASRDSVASTRLMVEMVDGSAPHLTGSSSRR
ncbi:hypothetical protein HQ346_16970 [Rhodococcus sp. BP-252]|uniref:hypothetical protein n=1 Tax=unclassified Rhodococcus (in: high G+C Gram-positive bacteria) TaxID=192944 RepID=UPI001C9AAC00|nr:MULTISPECIES: hypothetical protein [unclassified Rhodococcus (in: high G+C Gram-positive bacteria)]MBY6413389.1 hypothetical protein [Rhodococcus sp. BP-320]MBY6418007.1 hypothetical protein [Rhodococcus sp. BP-321]MBY6422303.1 hypothetical protein [Rhodococcus sp. BP-324]MBY6428056.1 hypothetical protein [Rhodococcus sp. BP-323]MBY6433310.1 hypothetical protein [Rhodococcus sp. BP-322]